MANADDTKVYQDLISFLKSDRADLRLAATEAAQQISDEAQLQALVDCGILVPLLKNVSDVESVASVNALQTLVRISTTLPAATATLVELRAIPRLVELVLSINPTTTTTSTVSNNKVNWKQQVHLALSLIANLTRSEAGALSLVGTSLPTEAVKELSPEDRNQDKPKLSLLLDRFLNPQYIDETFDYTTIDSEAQWDTLYEPDPFGQFATCLHNASQLLGGRQFVLKKQPNHPTHLETLVPLLVTAHNPIRRRGIAGLLRNVCLDTENAWWLLNEVLVLPKILYPLAGPEELDVDEKTGMDPDLWLQGPDKVREVDSSTRQYLVDAILLLCASGRKSRETIRLARTYVILKYADMVEEQESISERINECVQYLRRDEEGTAEGSSDQMVAEQTKSSAALNKLLLPPSTSASVAVVGEQDYDAVD